MSSPRVLEVDLESLTQVGLETAPSGLVHSAPARPRPWCGSSPAVDRIGRGTGAALAAALLFEHESAHPGKTPPFVLAVGQCVVRGVPTAARTTIASRAPLSGSYSDGSVGSDLARRLASFTDALVVSGRTRIPGAVLHLTRAGELELWSLPELVGTSPAEVQSVVTDRFGETACLRIGPAGEAGVPFANLVAGDAPHSTVGRGGMGSVLGALGLKAICISLEPIEHPVDASGLDGLLRSSPRLVARAEGGTLELMSAFAARGDLAEKNYSGTIDPERAARAAREASDAKHSRHGCKGCPTPCGWVFDGLVGGPRGGRFSALYALGFNLGLEQLDDALALLEACDRAGVDAKEMGATLALLCTAVERGLRADGPRFGARAELVRAIEDIARGDASSVSMPGIARGSASLARELGLEDTSHTAGGEALRPEHNLAALLGQVVSSRGVETMRARPFLLDASPAIVANLFAPFPVTDGITDALDPRGKGRIVWWHENLTAALDATGFCAFSAAGLLSDGVCGLDRLARSILPEVNDEERPGLELLAAGASTLVLTRELNRRWGARRSIDLPDALREHVEAPGMLDEYARWRGLDADGNVAPETLELLGETDLLFVGASAAPPADVPAPRPATVGRRSGAQARGSVFLRAFGRLGDDLGSLPIELDLPLTVLEVAHAVARERPRAADRLVRDSDLVPAVYRDGERLDAGEEVRDGDVLDLVLATSGG